TGCPSDRISHRAPGTVRTMTVPRYRPASLPSQFRVSSSSRQPGTSWSRASNEAGESSSRTPARDAWERSSSHSARSCAMPSGSGNPSFRRRLPRKGMFIPPACHSYRLVHHRARGPAAGGGAPTARGAGAVRAGRRKAARPPGAAVRAGRGRWSGVGGHVQVHDDRRVVGGALALALLTVHIGVGDRLGERLVAVDQVDADAPVLGEAQLAVVPVREGMLVLQGARDDVRQTGPAQGGEGGPLGGRDVGGALEGGPVVDVVVGRRHVVVAHHGERATAGRVTGDGGPQRLQPLEL